MRKLFSLILVIVLAITLIGCESKISTADVLVVGLEADYPPFNWLETKANDYNHPIDGMRGSYVAGYDVDVAKYLAAELNLVLIIKMIEWDSLIPALNSGDIDLVIAGMSPLPDRLEQIDFTNAYYESRHVAVVLGEGPLANATTLADLEGTIGVGQKGTTYADIVDWLGENHGVNVLPVVDNVPAIALLINKGDADFTIVEEPVAIGLVTAYPQLKIIFENNDDNIFEVADEDRIVSIGLSKGRDDLRNNLNTILDTITESQRTTWMERAIERAED